MGKHQKNKNNEPMVNNPRFPHTLRIYRSKLSADDTVLTDDAGIPLPPEHIYTSQCGYREPGKPRVSGDVIIADYKLALPKASVDIFPGDIIEVSDYMRTIDGVVVKSMTFNMGTNIWFNEIKN